MTGPQDGLYAAMLQRGLSRRAFLKFSAAMAATLALPTAYAARIAAAVAAAPRLPVIWLRGQDCGGNTEAFLAATDPTVAELVLDLLSVEYHESLMTPAGSAATLARTGAMETYPNEYIAVIEGGIPTADDGMACTIGGRAFKDIVREVGDGALATIAVGSCAFDGGTPAASGGPTGAVGAGQIVSDARLINLPGCPLNVENLTATIVHYLTFKEFPPTDSRRRPLFAYGGLLHNQCERRAHFEFGEFALAWGDEGAQKGWCLYKLGCKGPETYANCPTALYADGTSWAIKAGHGCIGCTMPRFWDAMGPAYQRLPSPLPFASTVSVDEIGLALLGGVAALTVAHGAASYARERWVDARERRPVAAGAVEGAVLQGGPAVAGPTAGIEPQPAEPTAGAGPEPAEPTAGIEPQPAEPTAGIEPQPAEPTAGIGPQPAEPTAGIEPQPAEPTASSGPPASEGD